MTRRIALFWSAAIVLAATPARSEPAYSDSEGFDANTGLTLGTPNHAESADFDVNTALSTDTPVHGDSASAPLNTTGINRAWGDSEVFSVDVPQAPPSLNSAIPQCDGITPGIALAWTAVPNGTNYDIFRNNTLIFTTQTAGTIFWNVTGLSAGAPYTYRIRARFTGGAVSVLSNSVSATAPTCSTPPPPESQPPSGHNIPPIQVTLDHLWEWDAAQDRFVQPPGNTVTIDPTKPTYLLAHGWEGSLSGVPVGPPCGQTQYAMTSIGCAIHEARPDANLLAWDWRIAANPNGVCDTDLLDSSFFGVLSSPGSAVQLPVIPALLDARRAGNNARDEGIRLGRALANEIVRHGSLGSELHLIGHSHGGGLLGMTARELRAKQYPVMSLTTLDTPKIGPIPGGHLVNSLKYVDPYSVESSGQVAVFYYSDTLFALAGGFGNRLTPPHDNLTNVDLNGSFPPNWKAHSWIRGTNDGPPCPDEDGWYNRSVWDAATNSPLPVQFHGSPLPSVLSVTGFPSGCYVEQGLFEFTGGECPEAGSESEESETPGMVLLRHEPFQTASTWFGTNAILTVGADPEDPENISVVMNEQGDASFFKDIDWPIKSMEITFDYMFRDPRGGESLTVYLDDEIIYYDNADTSLAVEQLRSSGATYVGGAAGTTARLTFVLRADETPGGSVVLDNIRTWGFIAGDMNGDGGVDGMDIQPFVNAMLAQEPDPADVYIGDFNNDGAVLEDDVATFVEALLQG